MRAAVVISGHKGWRRAVAFWFAHKFSVPVCEVEFPTDDEPETNSELATHWVPDQLRFLAARIEHFFSQNGGPAVLRETVGVIDFCSARSCAGWDGLDLLHERAHPAISAAGLVLLAYPEVHWLLHTPLDPPDKLFDNAHVLPLDLETAKALEWHSFGFCALFDPAGLRARLRKCLGDSRTSHSPNVCGTLHRVRDELVAVVDEEPAYAWFGSLVAFRAGYRALPVTTWRALRDWLGKDGLVPQFTFEDVYLNFPDRPRSFDDKEYGELPGVGHKGLSNLAFRDLLAHGLAETKRLRLLVTVGPGRDVERKRVWDLSWDYLSATCRRAALVYKPVSGIHVLLRKARLFDASRKQPVFPTDLTLKMPLHDAPHSAPGRLLAVADCLLARAANLLNKQPSLIDAVHAAVLSIEAKELLRYQTPTTALESIALQHEAEVIAESVFLGVDYNLNMRDRFGEIEAEVKKVARRFYPGRARRSAINAELSIIERLASRLRSLNQIEEEAACLARARRLRFDFWVYERPWPWRWLMWLPLRYLAFALSSLPRFGFCVAVWIILFGLIYFGLAGWTQNATWLGQSLWQRLSEGLAAAAYFTFTLQPASGWERVAENCSDRAALWNSLMAVQGAVSFLNLGLLLSHLYMIVSRR